MDYIELTLDRVDQIKKILSVDDSSLFNYFLNPQEKNYQMYGSFSDKLETVIGVIDSIEMPAWIVSKKHSSGDLIDLIEYVSRIKEQDKIFQFFTLFNDAEYCRFKNKNTRYTPYIEHNIEPGSLTGYNSIDHNILQYQMYPEPMRIDLWVLKNEYRTVEK